MAAQALEDSGGPSHIKDMNGISSQIEEHTLCDHSGRLSVIYCRPHEVTELKGSPLTCVHWNRDIALTIMR